MASSRIEELPDAFDESLDLNAGPIHKPLEDVKEVVKDAGQDGPASGRPPAGPPRTEGTSAAEEFMKQAGKTPLFMDQLDVEAAETQENVELEAMRALQYEGTRLEVAQGFKDEGNEQAKAKNWKDAREFYTKAIAALTGKVKIDVAPEDLPTTEEERVEETGKEQALLELCYVNRALCQLEMGNYRSTTLDCASALKINPRNVKAYYRSASALLKVGKIEEADDASNRGLTIDAQNAALLKLQQQIQVKHEAAAKLEARRKEEKRSKERQRFALAAALKARNIKVKGSVKAPDMEDAAIHLEPDPESPESSLVFPTVFFYPMHAQSDFVKTFGELQTIEDHLSYIFPLPWDDKGLYKPSAVECFMDTATGGMMKVGKKLSLLKLLSSGKTEVLDGLVRIHVVPSSMASQWIEQMKARMNS